MRAFARPLNLFFLFGGILLLAGVVYAVEWARLRTAVLSVQGMGWLVLVLYPAVSVWDTWGWRVVFAPLDRPRTRFWDLFGIRLTGEALNNVTPFIAVGGEYLKVLLVSRCFGIRKAAAASSLIIEQTALLVSEVVFWLVGAVPVFLYFPLPERVKWSLAGTLSVFAAAGVLLIFAQSRGFFGRVGRFFERRLAGAPRLPFDEIDRGLRSFYASEDRRWLWTVLLHLAGWIAGGVEMYFMLRVLGAPVTLSQAVVLESIMQFARSATFYIPGNLGAQEGVLAVAARWMAFDPALGVAASFLKRLRQAVWMVAGYIVWRLLDSRYPEKAAVEPRAGVTQAAG